MHPFVSVIIPVHNGERFLAEAIECVLNQKYAPLEIIVVDDGSTDDSARIAAAFGERLKYFYQPQQGPSAARNRGIERAQGEIIAFLDHDDLWAANSLRDQSAYLVAHPDIEIVQGLIVQIEQAPSASNPDEFVYQESSEPYQFINVGSALYRKHVFERVGGFDEEMRQGEDADWFLRAWEKDISKAVLPRVVLYYRRHEINRLRESGPWLLPRLFKMRLRRFRTGPADASMPVPETPHAPIADYFGQPPMTRPPRPSS